MFEDAIRELQDILESRRWVAELAGILPLSALIDFLDIAPKLHIMQLSSACPLWSWPITPAGARFLLNNQPESQGCYLDRYGNSTSLLGFDGRYGDHYYLSSPQTIRFCISAYPSLPIENTCVTMKGENLRIQNLQVIHIARRPRRQHFPAPLQLPEVFRTQSRLYTATSILGWILLLAMVAMNIILETYVALAFAVLMPITGLFVFAIHGRSPRHLLVDKESLYNRLILVTEHANSTDWFVFYGESTILNSILNRPLEPRKLTMSAPNWFLRIALRLCILGQWGLALGAAALKDWNAYFLSAWVAFCIFVHAYLIPIEEESKEWLERIAEVQMTRYQTQLSSRRALINAVVALNPDTFCHPTGALQEDRSQFDRGAMRWVDAVLEAGPSRTKWEEATLAAMNETMGKVEMHTGERGAQFSESLLSPQWDREFGHYYWKTGIIEGLYMAEKIKLEANLSGRLVPQVVGI
ncbi:hypothetical protein F5Y03DRAFT_123858 [Xylaria venustula]|nr:hypothetical protein F5Y03DRAFT_123858 [Xylaria venustula]